MSQPHSIYSPLSTLLFTVGTVLAGVAASLAARSFYRTYSASVDQLPPFPIVLKPQRWIIFLGAGLSGILACFALLEIFSPAFGHANAKDCRVLGLVLLPISAGGMLKVYAISGERLTLEATRLTHRKRGCNIVVEYEDIASIAFQKDYLRIKRKSNPKTLLISMGFQNIKYLNALVGPRPAS